MGPMVPMVPMRLTSRDYAERYPTQDYKTTAQMGRLPGGHDSPGIDRGDSTSHHVGKRVWDSRDATERSYLREGGPRDRGYGVDPYYNPRATHFPQTMRGNNND